MDIVGYIENIFDFFRLPVWRYLIYSFIFVIIIIWLSFIYWTFRDARLRSNSIITASFWALVVLVLNFLGLILYLILRPPEYLEDVMERDLEIKRMQMILDSKYAECPACGKDTEEDFLICPNCRKKLKNSCISCGKPVKLDWKVCPYCKTTQ